MVLGFWGFTSPLSRALQKLLLQIMMKGETFDVVPLIKQSIASVSKEKVGKCVANGLAEIEK